MYTVYTYNVWFWSTLTFCHLIQANQERAGDFYTPLSLSSSTPPHRHQPMSWPLSPPFAPAHLIHADHGDARVLRSIMPEFKHASTQAPAHVMAIVPTVCPCPSQGHADHGEAGVSRSIMPEIKHASTQAPAHVMAIVPTVCPCPSIHADHGRAR
jgi:hypothetical protein